MSDSSSFINPFHFVPPGTPKDDTPVDDVASSLQGKPQDDPFTPRNPELLHDRYANTGQHYSGRIDCKLTTKSPCVFGNEHEKFELPKESTEHEKFKLPKEKSTTRVDNFSITGNGGKQLAAIAGTSLKGMLSTLAEIASGSAMRVLNNRVFSIRSSMQQSRSAVGMIIERKDKDTGKTVRKLLPLTLPTFKCSKDKKHFKPSDGSENPIWSRLMADFLDTPFGQKKMPVYVTPKPDTKHKYYPEKRVVALPASKIPTIRWIDKKTGPDSTEPPPILKKDMRNTERTVLIRPAKYDPPPTIQDWKKQEDLVPGIVRTLGERYNQQGKADSSLAKPDYSLFVPIAKDWIDARGRFDTGAIRDKLFDKLLRADKACEDFDAIVGHPFSNVPHDPGRSATSLKNQQTFKIPKKAKRQVQKNRLRDGDIVFFRLKSLTEVESVSISSIWREGVRWMWDPDSGNVDLLDNDDRRPMNKHREHVTMAEKMFGWVDDVADKKDVSKEDRAKVPAYKGRVRISDAVSAKSLEEAQMEKNDKPHADWPEGVKEYYPLRILASPKPPCPEFYLTDTKKPKNQKIRAEFPSNSSSSIKIQGTKFYWVHPTTEEKDGVKRWMTKKETDDLHQKCFVRPIKPDVEFEFHVDFENLTEVELQLLCYSLHPTETFIHRCGFAKPLGLGAVKLTPTSISYIDRNARYREQTSLLTQAERFHKRLDLAAIKARSKGFAEQIGPQHDAIALAGRPVNVSDDGVEITYPRTGLQEDETKTYRWFVNNRDNRGKLLQPPLEPLISGEAEHRKAVDEAPQQKKVWVIAIDHRLRDDREVGNLVNELSRDSSLILRTIRSTRKNRDRLPKEGAADLLIGFSDVPNVPDAKRRQFPRTSPLDLDTLRAWLKERLSI